MAQKQQLLQNIFAILSMCRPTWWSGVMAGFLGANEQYQKGYQTLACEVGFLIVGYEAQTTDEGITHFNVCHSPFVWLNFACHAVYSGLHTHTDCPTTHCCLGSYEDLHMKSCTSGLQWPYVHCRMGALFGNLRQVL